MAAIENALRLARARRLLEKATIVLEKNSDTSTLVNPHFMKITDTPIEEPISSPTSVTKPKSRKISEDFKNEKLNIARPSEKIKKTEDIDNIHPYNKSMRKIDFESALRNNLKIAEVTPQKFIEEEPVEEVVEEPHSQNMLDVEPVEEEPISNKFDLSDTAPNIDVIATQASQAIVEEPLEELEELEEVQNHQSRAISEIKKAYLKSLSSTTFKTMLAKVNLNTTDLDSLLEDALGDLINATRKELNLNHADLLFIAPNGDEKEDHLTYRKIPPVTFKNIIADYLFNLQSNNTFLEMIAKDTYEPMMLPSTQVKSRNISMDFNYIGFANLLEPTYYFKSSFANGKQLVVRTNSYLITLPHTEMLAEAMQLMTNIPNQIFLKDGKTLILFNTPDKFAVENKLNLGLRALIGKGAVISLVNISDEMQLNVIRHIEDKDFVKETGGYGETAAYVAPAPTNPSIAPIPQPAEIELEEIEPEEPHEIPVSPVVEPHQFVPETEEELEEVQPVEEEPKAEEVETHLIPDAEFEFNSLNELDKYQLMKFLSKTILDIDFRSLDQDISKEEFNDYLSQSIEEFLTDYSRETTIGVVKTAKFRAKRISDPLNAIIENAKRNGINFRDLEYFDGTSEFLVSGSLEFTEIKNELLSAGYSMDALNMYLVLLSFYIKEASQDTSVPEEIPTPDPVPVPSKEEITTEEPEEELPNYDKETGEILEEEPKISYDLEDDFFEEDGEEPTPEKEEISYELGDDLGDAPMTADQIDNVASNSETVSPEAKEEHIEEPQSTSAFDLRDLEVNDDSEPQSTPAFETLSNDEVEIESGEEYEEDNGDDDEEYKEPMSKFKKIVIGTVAGLALFAAAGGGYLFLTGGDSNQTQEPAQSQQSSASNSSSSNTSRSTEPVGENAFSGGSSIQLETNAKLEGNTVKKLSDAQKTYLGITEDTINITVGDQNQDLKIEGYVVDSDDINWVKLVSQKDNKAYFVKFVQ